MLRRHNLGKEALSTQGWPCKRWQLAAICWLQFSHLESKSLHSRGSERCQRVHIILIGLPLRSLWQTEMRPKSLLRRDLRSQLLQPSHSDIGRQKGRTLGRKSPRTCHSHEVPVSTGWYKTFQELLYRGHRWRLFMKCLYSKIRCFFETTKALFLCSEIVTGFLVNSWKTTIYQKCHVISKLLIALYAFVYFLVLLLFYWSSRDWTQGLEHARQELYHWAASPVLNCSFFYFSF